MQNRKQSKLDQVKREAPFLPVHYRLPNPQLSLSLSICCSVYLLPACMLTLRGVCVFVCVLKKNQTKVPGSLFSVVYSSGAVQRRLQAHGQQGEIAGSEFPFHSVTGD